IQSCLLHHLRLPTHLSTPILSQGGYFGELSDGGSPRVIVYGYDRLPMHPVAPPSPNDVPGPEHPPLPVEDPEEDSEEDHADYPADGGDDDGDDDDTGDEDEEPFEEEEDDKEEEEHLALVDSSAVPITDPIPSAEDTK
ncbi:hypothetical protein Tco_0288455, partial [Tanacetum coccineum]